MPDRCDRSLRRDRRFSFWRSRGPCRLRKRPSPCRAASVPACRPPPSRASLADADGRALTGQPAAAASGSIPTDASRLDAAIMVDIRLATLVRLQRTGLSSRLPPPSFAAPAKRLWAYTYRRSDFGCAIEANHPKLWRATQGARRMGNTPKISPFAAALGSSATSNDRLMVGLHQTNLLTFRYWRAGYAPVARRAAGPLRDSDPYLLVLLADQEFQANRPEQAESLIEPHAPRMINADWDRDRGPGSGTGSVGTPERTGISRCGVAAESRTAPDSRKPRLRFR